MRPRPSPAAVAGPIFDPTLGLVIDNGNHLLLSGNHEALDYLDRIGARETLHDPGSAVFDFADLASGERWRLDLSEGRIPWWLFDRKRRVPGTRAWRIFRPARRVHEGAKRDSRRGDGLRGPALRAALAPAPDLGAQHDPPESSAALTAALLRETLAAGGKACHPLFAAHGLASSFIDPALAFLAAAGSPVRFGDRLRAIRFEDERAVALDFDRSQEELGADDSVILTAPPWIAKDLLPGLDGAGRISRHSQRPFPCHAATRASRRSSASSTAEIEWLFAFADRLSVTISNADRLIDRPRDELAAESGARRRR